MAEFPYEERRRHAWPWVLGLLLLLLLISSMALRPRGEVRDGASRLGAAEPPARPAPTAAEGEAGVKKREARDEAKDEDLERERMLRMRTRMIA